MAKRKMDEFYWQLGAELQRIDDEMAPAKPSLARSRKWQPRADVAETARAIFIKVELAGVRAEDIRVIYSRRSGRVTIAGVRRDDVFEGLDAAFNQLEISYGEFECGVTLPEAEVDPHQIRIQYAHGFLLIEVPKKDGVEPSRITLRRTITIRKI